MSSKRKAAAALGIDVAEDGDGRAAKKKKASVSYPPMVEKWLEVRGVSFDEVSWLWKIITGAFLQAGNFQQAYELEVLRTSSSHRGTFTSTFPPLVLQYLILALTS